MLAFAVFGIFVVFAAISSGKADSLVTETELDEVRKLSLFMIGALLPSDFLIRFGRNLLFQNPELDASKLANAAPSTTFAQVLAFATFIVVSVLTLLSNEVISTAEFSQVNEVARILIVALLPSDAGIRFGRALYYRAPTTPTPTDAAMQRM